MRVLVSGASGFIGTPLVRELRAAGHGVTRLVRGRVRAEDEVAWDPRRLELDPKDLAGHDAVVHLAGESIASRWSPEKKRRILQSRVDGTKLLVKAVLQLSEPPRVFVCSSGVGIYGDRGAEELTEESALGDGFLADVGRQWEAQTKPAREAGIRVARLRTGAVLDPSGRIALTGVNRFSVQWEAGLMP